MTQTNNEREALIADAEESGFHNHPIHGLVTRHSNGSWVSVAEKLEKFAELQLARAISQNEQKEAALKVYQGEICYKSHADDQSYGMWCPVGYDTTQLYKEGTEFFTSTPKQAIPEGMDEIKKDAERYRFLRLCDLNEFGIPCIAIQHTIKSGLFLSGEDADEAIDQAISNSEFSIKKV